jgi:hypothetical protein
MAELIERICIAHPRRDPLSPLVTFVEGAWAYCAGNAEQGHIWKPIEPTRAEYVGTALPLKSRPASFVSRWRAGIRARGFGLRRRP